MYVGEYEQLTVPKSACHTHELMSLVYHEGGRFVKRDNRP